MAENIFYRLGAFITGGKDAYTQTNFGSYVQWGLQKGETTVDTTWDNLYELARTTPQVAAVIDRKASMYSNGRWKHYKLVNGKKTLVENSDAVYILENPNPIQNGSELDKSMIWSDETYGNSMVNSMYENSIVSFMNENSRVNYMYKNSIVNYMYDSKTQQMQESAYKS